VRGKGICVKSVEEWKGIKLENVLVSLHSLKTMGLGSIIFKEWRVTWTFSYTKCIYSSRELNNNDALVK
jgi:uncharacterized protein (DUF697 family)